MPFPAGTVVASGSLSSAFSLAVGVNLFLVSSSQDGDYLLTVTRAAQDMTALAVQAQGLTNFSSTPQSTAFALTPAFVAGSGIRSFTLSLPYLRRNFTLQLQFSVLNSAYALLLSSAAYGFPATVQSIPLASTIASSSYPLAVSPATNLLTIRSSQDGDYNISISRAVQAVTGLTAVTFETSGAGPSPLLLTPPFAVHQMRFTASVPYVVASLVLSASFSAGTVDLSSGQALVSSLSSGTDSSALPLSVGVNDFYLYSNLDGMYLLSVERRPGDVTAVSLVARGAATVWAGSRHSCWRRPSSRRSSLPMRPPFLTSSPRSSSVRPSG